LLPFSPDHGDAGLIHGDDRKRSGVGGVGQRLADGDLGDARDRDDVAGAGVVGRHAVEGVGHEELGHLGRGDGAVGAAPRDDLALADSAVVHTAQRQPAEVGRGVEVGDVGLKRRLVVVGRRRGCREDLGEQRREVGRLREGSVRRSLASGPTYLGRGVEDGEVDLRLVGVEVEEQLVRLIDHGLDAGV
jgi:hypothetical protein